MEDFEATATAHTAIGSKDGIGMSWQQGSSGGLNAATSATSLLPPLGAVPDREAQPRGAQDGLPPSKVQQLAAFLGVPPLAVLGAMVVVLLLSCCLLAAFCSGALDRHRHQKIAAQDSDDEDSDEISDEDDVEDGAERFGRCADDYAFAEAGENTVSEDASSEGKPKDLKPVPVPVLDGPQHQVIAAAQNGLSTAVEEAAEAAKAKAKAELDAALRRLNDME